MIDVLGKHLAVFEISITFDSKSVVKKLKPLTVSCVHVQRHISNNQISIVFFKNSQEFKWIQINRAKRQMWTFPDSSLLTAITITHTRKSLWRVSCLSTAYVLNIFRFKEFLQNRAPNSRAPTPGVLHTIRTFKPRNAGRAGHAGRIRKTRNMYRILLRESC